MATTPADKLTGIGVLQLVPCFSGDDTVTIKTFLDTLREAAKLADWTKKQTVGVLKIKLTGTAANFANYDKTFKEGYENGDLDSVTRTLKNRFEKASDHDAALQLLILGVAQRPGERVSEFGSRIRVMAEMAMESENDRNSIEKIAKGAFLRNLLPHIRSRALVHRDKSFDEVVAETIKEENTLRAYHLDTPYDPADLVRTLGFLNNDRTNQTQPAPRYTSNQRQNWFRTNNYNDPNRQRPRRLSCFRCGGSHFARDCRNNTSSRRVTFAPQQPRWRNNQRQSGRPFSRDQSRSSERIFQEADRTRRQDNRNQHEPRRHDDRRQRNFDEPSTSNRQNTESHSKNLTPRWSSQ